MPNDWRTYDIVLSGHCYFEVSFIHSRENILYIYLRLWKYPVVSQRGKNSGLFTFPHEQSFALKILGHSGTSDV